MSASTDHFKDLSGAHPLFRDGAHDRIVGTLIGSALGDAIGLYTEFMSAATSADAYPSRNFTLTPVPTPFYRDMHRLKHQLGDWTDDTDHSLLILLSFLHNGDLQPRDFAQRLKNWVDMGLRALDTPPLGLGALVGSIVRNSGYVGDPEGTATGRWEASQRHAAPNGSLMRTHPLGLICLPKSEAETFEVAAQFSRMTHVDPRCVVSCAIGTTLVRNVVRGEVQSEEDIEGVIKRALDWYLAKPQDEPLDLEELRRHTGAKTLTDLKLDEHQKIGYVYKTLGSGILLLRLALAKIAESKGSLRVQLDIFKSLITELIMQGGDADTNACFAGALLGGHLGYRALPEDWKHGLRHKEWLQSKSEALAQVLGAVDGNYSGKEDKDTHLDGGRGFLTKEEMETRWKDVERGIFLTLEADAKERASASKKKLGWGLPWKDR